MTRALTKNATSASEPVIYKSPHPPISPYYGNAAQFIRDHPPADPDAPLFLDAHSPASLSFNELMRSTEKFADMLASRFGLAPGKVAIFFSNSHIYVPAMHWAILSLGAIVSPANVMYTPAELLHQLTLTGAELIIVRKYLLPVAQECLRIAGPEFKNTKIVTTDELIADLPNHKGRRLPMEISEDECDEMLAYLCCSSGTSGKPKAVMTTHFNIVSNTLQTVQSLPSWNAGIVCGTTIPVTHIYGLTLNIYVTTYLGCRNVLFEHFDLDLFLRKLVEHKVTHTTLVPPIIVRLAKSPIVDKYKNDLGHWKVVLSAAAPLSTSLCRQVQSRLPELQIMQAYGLTEASPLTHVTDITRHKDPGSIGPLVSSCVARLVDESGNDVPEGSKGEIWISGPNIMKGYLNNASATEETLTSDRWLRTGDIAIVTPDHLWYIVDRRKELIKSKGHQVAPAELEGLLLQHPDVVDCAVTGFAVPEQGTELPRAFVVLKSGADPLKVKQWFDHQVASYKRLWGGIVVIDAVPKNGSGKILRRLLRERKNDIAFGYSDGSKL